MDIKVLGPGCPNCEELKKRTEQALSELGMNAEVIKVSDMTEIVEHTLSTPGLLINGKLKHAGKPLPPSKTIKSLIGEEAVAFHKG